MNPLPNHTCTSECWREHAAGRCLHRRGRTYCGLDALHQFVLVDELEPFKLVESPPASPHAYTLSLGQTKAEKVSTRWMALRTGILAYLVGMIAIVLIQELTR